METELISTEDLGGASSGDDFGRFGDFSLIVIGPGPGRPSQYPQDLALMQRYYHEKPILGICLGMQCIGELFGGRTLESGQPVHGRTGRVEHDGSILFSGVEQDFPAARYHSLVCSDISAELLVSARDRSDGTIMALRHRRYPLLGLQFHPESFMTPDGPRIIANYLKMAGLL